MVEPVIDSDSANEALRIVRHLEPKYRITEVPNPAYAKSKRDRQAFSPQQGTIKVTDKPVQPSLAEQMAKREQRFELKVLNLVIEICDFCPECSDCTFAKEMQAIDRCYRVKRNLEYLGVI